VCIESTNEVRAAEAITSAMRRSDGWCDRCADVFSSRLRSMAVRLGKASSLSCIEVA
jgi:hypothetical protein